MESNIADIIRHMSSIFVHAIRRFSIDHNTDVYCIFCDSWNKKETQQNMLVYDLPLTFKKNNSLIRLEKWVGIFWATGWTFWGNCIANWLKHEFMCIL